MIWTFLVKGGPLMIPILIVSMIGLAIVIERAIFLLKISDAEGKSCLDRTLEEIRQRRLSEALSAAQSVDHPVAAVLQRGLEQWGLPPETVERSMEQAAQTQIRFLEKWLGGLASVITMAPMLGFLGTITGLIRAFMAWEAAGARVSVSQLAGGIYESMITTAAGLLIAIPLLAIHNAFLSRIKRIAAQTTDAGNELLELYTRLQTKPPINTTREAARHAPLSSAN